MTGKERAQYRKQANPLPPVVTIGKGDIGEALISSVDGVLTKRELIKLSVLETATVTAREAAEILAEATGAEIIQCIGRKFVLYRENPDKNSDAAQ
jgi:RNA-binding protein